MVIENKDSIDNNLEKLKNQYSLKKEELQKLYDLSGTMEVEDNPGTFGDTPFLVTELAHLLIDIQRIDNNFVEENIWINKEVASIKNQPE